MADIDKRESGATLMFIGLAVWVVDLLVVFFLPAGMKLGKHAMFISIIVVLALLGMILMVVGIVKRGKTGAEE